MKLAKASQHEADALLNLMQVLNSHEDFNTIPCKPGGEWEEGEDSEIFDPNDRDHLRKFYDRVTACFADLPGGLSRTIGGFHLAWVNDVFDPAADTYEWHPTLVAAVEARQNPKTLTFEDKIRLLAAKHVWVAPVGHQHWPDQDGHHYDTHGYMVCKRETNNVDGCGNTRIDYLVNGGAAYDRWKKPFQYGRCLFPTFEAALEEACKVMDIKPRTPEDIANSLSRLRKCLRHQCRQQCCGQPMGHGRVILGAGPITACLVCGKGIPPDIAKECGFPVLAP